MGSLSLLLLVFLVFKVSRSAFLQKGFFALRIAVLASIKRLELVLGQRRRLSFAGSECQDDKRIIMANSNWDHRVGRQLEIAIPHLQAGR